MKKSFWGYNVAETEDMLESMQNQCDLMTTRIATLTMELNSVKEELERRNEDAKSLRHSEQQNTELKQKITDLENTNASLSRRNDTKLNSLVIENEALTKKLLKLESALPEKAPAHTSSGSVGAICERAYRDMDRMKRETAAEVKQTVNNFSDIIGDANANIRYALSDVKEEYTAMVNQLTESFRNMLESFETVESYRKQMEEKMLPVEQITSGLKVKIDSLVDNSLTDDICDTPPEEISFVAEKPDLTPSETEDHIEDESFGKENYNFWQRYYNSDKSEEQSPTEETDDPVINVVTNINPKDIFGT